MNFCPVKEGHILVCTRDIYVDSHISDAVLALRKGDILLVTEIDQSNVTLLHPAGGFLRFVTDSLFFYHYSQRVSHDHT